MIIRQQKPFTKGGSVKVVKILGIVVGAIIVLLLIYLGYYGAFAKVTVTEKKLDSFWMVYQKHVGEYKGVGPIMDAIYNDLKDNYSISTTKGFGAYYDNPREVPKEKCRSIAGCILENADLGKVDELKEKYFVREYPTSSVVTAEFPFKGTLSIFIGIFKVYPKLGKYITEKGYESRPMFEIYDMPAKKTIYGMSKDLDAGLFDSFLEEPVEPVIEEETGVADTAEVIEEE